MNNDYFQMYYANEKIERYRHEAEIERMLNQVKKNQSTKTKKEFLTGLATILKSVSQMLHIGGELTSRDTSPKMGQS